MMFKTDKGTGAVMCCTFGDEVDVNWWRKYGLDLKVVINNFGKLHKSEELGTIGFCENSNNTKKTYDDILANKKIKIAREDFIKYLSENKLLSRLSENIKHNVKCAERSGAPIEFVTQNQWYIKLTQFKKELIEQINKCNWHPDYMKVRAIQWCEKLTANWCISRQRFFGVPFPAWHVNKEAVNAEIIVADFHELPIDPCDGKSADSITKITKIFAKRGYQDVKIEENGLISASKDGEIVEITPETDILDTWATSSISPQLSSGLVSEEMLANLTENNAISEDEAKKKCNNATKNSSQPTCALRHMKLFAPGPSTPSPKAFYTILTIKVRQKTPATKNQVTWLGKTS